MPKSQKELMRLLTNCANEHLFTQDNTKTDCDYCPVFTLCYRVWNNSGNKELERKIKAVTKIKHMEKLTKFEWQLLNPYIEQLKHKIGGEHALEA